MKEEIFGLEDCFRFASNIMHSYSKTEFEGKDNSVELYLLNHWVKDLSLRDLIDRVAFTCTNFDNKYFLCLFKWILFNNLSHSSEEKWVMEDLRKIAVLLGKYCKTEEVREFFG